MGISGNILDLNYNSSLDIPSILSEWASQCVAAYYINQTSCTFAEKSIKATNPTEDIMSRITSMASTLAVSARYFAGVPTNILDLSLSILTRLGGPMDWPILDQYFTALEQDFEEYIPPQPIDENTPPSGYNENLTLSSYNTFGPPPYAQNDYLWAAVMCVDGSLENIATTDAFAGYIEGQISQNAAYGAILAYNGVYGPPLCLSWNATLNNAEIYRFAFPSSIKNKILMVAETLNSVWSYEGAFATYEYVGSQNAALLIHDGIGPGVYWDPNDCTYNEIREYLVTGVALQVEANLGILPTNGTVCKTDHSGMNNVFIQNPTVSLGLTGEQKSNLKLVLGLVLGVALPITVGMMVAYGYCNLRRKSRREAVSHIERLKNGGAITEAERGER